MNKIAAAILCIILSLPFLVTYTVISVQKNIKKKEVKHKLIQGLKKSELALIALSKKQVENELTWEHANEFEYNGHMFDVVSTEVTADSIKYWCWPDNDETHLNKMLTALASQATNQQQKESTNTLISFFKSFFFINSSELASLIKNTISPTPEEEFSLLTWVEQPPSPPPK